MHCKYCGFGNGADDHRCLRCGRRTGIAIAAPAGFSGANALAVAPAFDPNESQDFRPQIAPDAAAQPRLFNAPPSKVISFEELQRHVTGKLQAQAPSQQARVSVPKPAGSPSRPAAEQTTMDFVPGSPLTPRVLKTAVPAQIYCEQQVATPMHRFIAGALDGAMILLAFGFFVVAAEAMGMGFGSGRMFWIEMGGGLALIAMFYGLIWAIAGCETAGMRWTDLQLITFDGFPVDARSRASRVATTWLSFCSGGLGLIWAMADEENLTWHDHISKTFPTVREVPKSFVQQGRRR